MKKKFFIIIFFIFGLVQKSFAYSSDPKQFIQEVVDEAKQVLVETNSKEYKTKKLSEMALQTVDIKGVAYYSLGNYREKLNEEQMKEYLVLFEKYFLKTFTSRLLASLDKSAKSFTIMPSFFRVPTTASSIAASLPSLRAVADFVVENHNRTLASTCA